MGDGQRDERDALSASCRKGVRVRKLYIDVSPRYRTISGSIPLSWEIFSSDRMEFNYPRNIISTCLEFQRRRRVDEKGEILSDTECGGIFRR